MRGYEIHMGSTGDSRSNADNRSTADVGSIVDSECVIDPKSRGNEKRYMCRIQNEADGSVKYDGIFSGNVYGTYVHGILTRERWQRHWLVSWLNGRVWCWIPGR